MLGQMEQIAHVQRDQLQLGPNPYAPYANINTTVFSAIVGSFLCPSDPYAYTSGTNSYFASVGTAPGNGVNGNTGKQSRACSPGTSRTASSSAPTASPTRSPSPRGGWARGCTPTRRTPRGARTRATPSSSSRMPRRRLGHRRLHEHGDGHGRPPDLHPELHDHVRRHLQPARVAMVPGQHGQLALQPPPDPERLAVPRQRLPPRLRVRRPLRPRRQRDRPGQQRTPAASTSRWATAASASSRARSTA